MSGDYLAGWSYMLRHLKVANALSWYAENPGSVSGIAAACE